SENGKLAFIDERSSHSINTGKSRLAGSADLEKNTRSVDVVSIDDFLPEKGKTIMIKIDVEGFELDVLKGLRETLLENTCFLAIEIFEQQYAKCEEFLGSLGYSKQKQFSHADFGFCKCKDKVGKSKLPV
ncbi:FkbM family methyltransferase, partial [Akkermansiaceae bacterium]|nr:FkbM family methyltransferase [Akkermansiaceae bacterium]